jgi:hypothetical protein
MEILNERIPHSVRLHERFSRAIYETNCFMVALDIKPDAVTDMRLGDIFPGKHFVNFLLANGYLCEVAKGSVVVYFRGDSPVHAGKHDGAVVISKWGAAATHIWRHALWDVPRSYGDEVRFFRRLPTAVDLYRDWAAARGL